MGWEEMESLNTHIYRGKRGQDTCLVTVDGAPLDPRIKAVSVPLAEFEWGYKGGGPGRLAFAILAHHLGDDRKALASYRTVRDNVVAELRGDEWELNSAQIESSLRGSVEVPMTLNELFDKVRGSGT